MSKANTHALTSRNQLHGRYSGHSFGFHHREDGYRQALVVSHRNAYIAPTRENTLPITAADAAMLIDLQANPRQPNEAMKKMFSKAKGVVIPQDPLERKREAKSWRIMMREALCRQKNKGKAPKGRKLAGDAQAMTAILEMGRQQINEGKVLEHAEVVAQLAAEDTVEQA